MPEMPQLKKYPYQTEKRCPICHPHSSSEPPFYDCVSELPYAGTQVQRNLLCPNCDNREADIFDQMLGRVTFDKRLEQQSMFRR